jgi:hypothetical protein
MYNNDSGSAFWLGTIVGFCLCGLIVLFPILMKSTILDVHQYKCTDERIVNHMVVCYQYSKTEEK